MNNDQDAYMVFFDNGEVWRISPDQPLSHGEIEAMVKRTIRSIDYAGCVVEVVREGTQPRVVNIIGWRVLEGAEVVGEEETLPRPRDGRGVLRWLRRHASKTTLPSLPEMAD